MKKIVRLLSVLAVMAMLVTCVCSLSACSQRGAAAAAVNGNKGAERKANVIYGDVDYDAEVTMKDVLVLRKKIAGYTVVIDENAADVNVDGSIDMKDVLLIRKFVGNFISKFPAEQGVSRTTATSNTSTTTTTTKKTTTTTQKVNPNEPLIDFIKGTDHTLGVWWWYRLPQNEDSYLDLLQRNQVTEIYYCLGSTMQQANYRTTFHNFIQKAMAHGMRVFLLDGDKSWIDEPTDTSVPTRLEKDITGCTTFKSEYPSDAFAGLHLDVEPKPSDATMRAYVEVFLTKAQAVREAGMLLEVDLGCGWWSYGKSVSYNGQTGIFNIIAHMVDTMTMMSYRDTADEMYFISIEALKAAKAAGTKIVFGIELGDSKEADKVDFSGESLSTAWKELKKFDQKLASENLSIPYGYAIHSMDTMATLRWYE